MRYVSPASVRSGPALPTIAIFIFLCVASLAPDAVVAGCAQARQECGLFQPCCGSLKCNLFASPAECRHDPPREGEACSIFSPCADDLYCKGFQDGAAGRCTKPSRIGESCDGIVTLCGDGLLCRPDPRPNSLGDGRCFPEAWGWQGGGGLDWQNDAACLNAYSFSVHRSLPTSNLPFGETHAMAFGSGWTGEAAVAGSAERGGIYGDDGSFGCYRQQCLGAGFMGLAQFAAVSEYESFDSATSGPGYQVSTGTAAIAGYSHSVFWNIAPDNPQARPVGEGSAMTFGAQWDLSAQTLVCTIETNTVVRNWRVVTGPEAKCRDATACADADSCVAQVSVDDGSTAEDGTAPTLEQIPTSPYAIGEHQVTLRVTDGSGAVDTCSATVDVHDCAPPDVTCRPTVAECQANRSAHVDPLPPLVEDCSSYTIAGPPAGDYPLGSTPVQFKVTDSYFNEASCTTHIEVRDTKGPVIRALVATPTSLWPPNHTMRPVQVTADFHDACDPQASCRIVSVKGNEPDRAAGRHDDRSGDILIVGPLSLQLRAERLGDGASRIYTVVVECSDTTGSNATRGEVQVTVPHDSSRTAPSAR